MPWAILDKLAVVVFVLSLMMFSFAYGVIAHRFKVFPYAVMWEAMVAAKEFYLWTELVFKLKDKDFPHVIVASEGEFRTAARHDDRRAYTGLTLAEAYADGRFRLLLLDMAGEVQHRWTVPDSVYRQLMERDWSLDVSDY